MPLQRIFALKLGSLWMLVASFGFAMMGVFVKLGAQKFTSAELVFYRSLFGFLVIFLFTFRASHSLKSPVLGLQIQRGIVGFISLVMFFYAITYLPLATAITLNYTSPLFLAVLVTFIYPQHHTPSKPLIYLALGLGFIGVIGLLQPSFTKQDWLAGIIGLASGVGAAFAYYHVKQLGQASEPDWRTVFYFTLISTIGSGLWMLIHASHALTLEDLPVLIGLGVFATGAQLAMTRAYRTGETLTVASLAYTTVIFATLLGWLIFAEILSWIEIFAMLLIIISGIISVRASKT